MLAQCPNCRATISTRSIRCPECHGPLRNVEHQAAAKVFWWTFAAFNLLMALWVAFYLLTGRVTLHRPADIQQAGDAAGTPVAGNLGLGFLFMLWMAGVLILGLCAAFSLAHAQYRGGSTRVSGGK